MEIIREYDTDNAPSTNEECLPLYNEWKDIHFKNLKNLNLIMCGGLPGQLSQYTHPLQ